MLHFTKMHGCGNDYIYFDCFRETVTNPCALSERISDRHFGVGGDGIVMICPSDVADAKMRMFNADGSEGKMCGNAIRCVAKYLYERRGIRKPVLTVETLSGIKTLTLHLSEEDTVETVTVDMGAAIFAPEKIPCTLAPDADGRVIKREVETEWGTYFLNAVSMGNPHCVLFLHENFTDEIELEMLDIEAVGSCFEYAPFFPDRVNTEFVKVEETGLSMRVWERGSGETFACGTGACAVAAAAVANGFFPMDTDIPVKLRGGTLIIRVTPETVYMTGPATIVFDGEIEE